RPGLVLLADAFDVGSFRRTGIRADTGVDDALARGRGPRLHLPRLRLGGARGDLRPALLRPERGGGGRPASDRDGPRLAVPRRLRALGGQPRRGLPHDRVHRQRLARPHRRYPGRPGTAFVSLEPRGLEGEGGSGDGVVLSQGGEAVGLPAAHESERAKVWRAVWELLHDLVVA